MRLHLNGTALNVVDEGRSDPALVLLHSFGGSCRSWSPLIERLAGAHRCVAPDLRGFGASDAPATGYAVGDRAYDVAALVEALGLESFVLVGHSMGGKIAQALAALRPAGLRALVLLAPSPPTPEPMSGRDRAELLAGHGDRDAALATARKVTVRPLAPSLLDQVVDDMLRAAGPAWTAWLEEGSRDDISAQVGRLSTPALVASGTGDVAIPTSVLAREVMPSLKRGRLVTVPGAGHLLPLEAPDEVAGLIATVVQAASSPLAAAG